MFSLIACCSSFPAICGSLSLCVWVCVREDDQQVTTGENACQLMGDLGPDQVTSKSRDQEEHIVPEQRVLQTC